MSVNIIEMSDYSYSNKNIYPYIVQIGTGGTGGYLVQHIAQMLGITKTPASYMIVDPDIIEKKNLGNQLFLKEEVGLKKADVLASRYSAAYDIEIASYSESFIESVDDVKKLFSTEYLHIPRDSFGSTLFLPIVIGCVDNNFTRQIIHEFFGTMQTCIYIDGGNETATVPVDWQQRPKKEWTEEELKAFNQSGWSGQVVTGVKLRKFNQSPVAEMFPDILSDEDDMRPSELSCDDISASDPQRLIVNKYAALAIFNTLSNIIEEKTISTHVTVFHAKQGYMRSTLVDKETNQTH